MSRSNTEVEIKLRVPSAVEARERLARAGARETAVRTFEDNGLFERAEQPLHATGRMLRLRRCGDIATLTYKAPVPGEHRHKVREEHETRVADPAAIERILGGLGFTPAYRYQKYRTSFELAGVVACLDETPIGCFLELEGAPEAIDRAAALLGFGLPDYLKATYRELHEAAAGRTGAALGDLVFDPAHRPA